MHVRFKSASPAREGTDIFIYCCSFKTAKSRHVLEAQCVLAKK